MLLARTPLFSLVLMYEQHLVEFDLSMIATIFIENLVRCCARLRQIRNESCKYARPRRRQNTKRTHKTYFFHLGETFFFCKLRIFLEITFLANKTYWTGAYSPIKPDKFLWCSSKVNEANFSVLKWQSGQPKYILDGCLRVFFPLIPKIKSSTASTPAPAPGIRKNEK